ncbi:MAG: membrane protein insertion efficiency factor YidD [Candidatus Omnitrophica bacterium]|nr:membrane protein insertion efficiency factor YidD [Candidatus Omnitrophota bacterium]
MLKNLCVLIIQFYQVGISPLFPSHCRHQPTCSEYTIKAIQRFGVLKGARLGIKRILSCTPWGSYGYDPVPKNSKR